MTKKTKTVPFRLVNITTEQFAEFKENLIEGSSQFDIDLKTKINVSNEQKVVGIFTKYLFTQEGELILTLECACHFELVEEFWSSNISENILTLNKELLTHLLVLTVGTSRGVLHAKKPKWLNNLFLPTWNVSSIIEEDLQIDITKNTEEEE